MSKSRGNIIVPDDYIRKFGADTLRLYLMFLGPFDHGGDFRDTGIEGMHRFVKRLWRLFTQTQNSKLPGLAPRSGAGKTQILAPERVSFMHKTIKAVTEDVKSFSYNTAIARMMEWYNFLSEQLTAKSQQLTAQEAEVFLKLLAPFAPHLTEELFEKLNLAEGTIHKSDWPEYDEKYLVEDQVTVVVQVNGKRRGEILVESSKLKVQSEIEELARKEVEKHVKGKTVKNVIYVPGRIINFVI